MKNNFLCILIVLVASMSLAAQQPIAADTSRFDEEFQKEIASRSSNTPETLAEMANRLAQKWGFEFSFEPGEFKEQNVATAGAKLSRFDLQDGKGGKLSFLSPERNDHPCGSSARLPVITVTPKRLTVVSNGKSYEAAMPPEFVFDEVELVDRTLKKSIRSWAVPLDHTPKAISPDGMKIYISADDDRLLIEIDSSGRYRYVPHNMPGLLKDGKDLTDFPEDKDNAYLGFREYKKGRTSYFVKFSHPCT